LYLESKYFELKTKIILLLNKSKNPFLKNITKEVPSSNDTIFAKQIINLLQHAIAHTVSLLNDIAYQINIFWIV